MQLPVSYTHLDAIYYDARLKNYFVTLGDNEIKSDGEMMSYGKYFNLSLIHI